jgi:hypothetical protein
MSLPKQSQHQALLCYWYHWHGDDLCGLWGRCTRKSGFAATLPEVKPTLLNGNEDQAHIKHTVKPFYFVFLRWILQQ